MHCRGLRPRCSSLSVLCHGPVPRVVRFSLCAGRAVVMPRVGDAAEWIDAHRAGWTSAPAVASLSEALLAALDSGDRASEAGEHARQLAAGPLSWSAVAEGVDAFYRRIVLST